MSAGALFFILLTFATKQKIDSQYNLSLLQKAGDAKTDPIEDPRFAGNSGTEKILH